MADEHTGPALQFGVTGGQLAVTGGEYDPGYSEEIDSVIRNLPEVVNHCLNKAEELLSRCGSNNFEIVLSTTSGGEVFNDATDALGRRHYLKGGGKGSGTSTSPEKQRPRAYVAPANNKGIHEELSDAVLLKAALGMAGK